MTDSKFIPELHDIGKLIDDSLKEKIKNQYGTSWKSHVLVDLDFTRINISKPNSPSWWGQFHHDKSKNDTDLNQWNDVPEEFREDLFLLKIADIMAASFGRTSEGERNGAAKTRDLLKLWNLRYSELQRTKGFNGSAFRDMKGLTIAIGELQNCASSQDFLARYQETLKTCPEDKMWPNNLNSLYSHLVLVGKLYRMLKKNVQCTILANKTLSLLFDGKDATVFCLATGTFLSTLLKAGPNDPLTQVDNVRGKWRIQSLFCEVRFPTSFARLHDLNIYRKFGDLLVRLKSRYPDEVIYSNSTFLFIILPESFDLTNFFQDFLLNRFKIYITRIRCDLGLSSSILGSILLKARSDGNATRVSLFSGRNARVETLLLDRPLPEIIQGSLCDICQQNQGMERVTEQVREYICDQCEQFRDMGEPFRVYGDQWDREGVKVAWFRISLDQQKLRNWLVKRFKQVLEKEGFSRIQEYVDAFRPLAIQMDFNDDYQRMVSNFWLQCQDQVDFHQPIKDFNEIGVCKFSSQNLRVLIQVFIDSYKLVFNDCVGDMECPISLSISIAHIKYPIREHWRFFEQHGERSFLNIHFHNIFEENYSLNEVETSLARLAEGNGQSYGYLNRIVQIRLKTESELLVTSALIEAKFKHPELFAVLKAGVHPLKFLNLYTILNEQPE